jgi:glutamate-1-semialdehyde 2,1-aminomutase
MPHVKSHALFEKAVNLLPGGVSSPVRAFKHVGGTPLFMKRGEGAFVIDEDDNRYVDFCMAWGPLILGHAEPSVVEAVTKATRDGLAFGTVHRHEQALAELILSGFTDCERVRFVVSGTEAVTTAVRLARAATGRAKLLKFEGCYHGSVDPLLVKAGSGLVTLGLPDSQGVPDSVSGQSVVVTLGDVKSLEQAFEQYGSQIAAAIIEPLPANNGMLPQSAAFIRRLRELTTAHKSLLIFDEVISGFRVGFHGMGKLLDVKPDLVTLGKVIGGGLPVGAITGSAALLDQLAPLGKVYQAGTMAGNPVALSAGIATLTALKSGSVYARLEELSQRAAKHFEGKSNVSLVRQGSILWPYFDRGPAPTTTAAISSTAVGHYREHYRAWLDAGLYLPPSAYEVCFLSAAHTEAQVDLWASTLLSRHA